MSIKKGQITNSLLYASWQYLLRKASDYASTYDYTCPKTTDLQVVKAVQNTTTQIVKRR